MARPKQTIQSVYRNLAIPEPLAAKLDLELYSTLEGRIPTGAYKEFFANLLEQHFAAKHKPCQKCGGTGVRGVL